jgi:hypothetical protein
MAAHTAKTRWSAAAALLLVLLCLAAPAAAKDRHRSQGMYWGGWIGSQLTGTPPPWDMSAVSQFEALVGKSLSMIEFAAPFAVCSSAPCSFYPFPTTAMDSVRNYGAIPFLSWSSASTPSSLEQPDFQLSDVIDGTYDSYIREFATEAASWGHPFFLRFDWEVNGNWFPWGESVNGNRSGEYVAAWRHVHDIFTSVGATNATWVWCPYADERQKFGPLRSFYPGSRYVDWTCLDAYNWGANAANPVPWKSFEQLFSSSYRRILKVAPHKPLLLGELASSGEGRAKAIWIRRMFAVLKEKFPRVRGLIWFEQTMQGISWPLESSPAATRAFAQGLRRYRYRGNRYGAISGSPIQPPR